MTEISTREPLVLQLLAELDVSAASGLVLRDDTLWVVADDELALTGYDRAGRRTRELRLLGGALPDAAAARKAHKPDLEALLELPDGTLLALGSGSTPARRRGVWVQVASGSSRVVDLSQLYLRLERELPELNIEGGALLGETLYLSSRGNGARRQNALIQLAWPECARALRESRALPVDALRSISAVKLGELTGQALGFTDLAVSGDRLLFTAAAEASPNTYEDGACAGSAVGVLSPQGEVQDLVPLAGSWKIEGLWAAPAADAFELWLVADPDERSARAPLLTTSYRPQLRT